MLMELCLMDLNLLINNIKLNCEINFFSNLNDNVTLNDFKLQKEYNLYFLFY